MGFLHGNSSGPNASPAAILDAIKTPGLAGGTSLDDIVAAGNTPAPNVLAQLAQQPAAGEAAPARKRVSTLDIIGGIADAIAGAGGATQGYAAGVDRKREIARQELDDSWKEKFNAQKLTAGENELQAAHTARLGQAARGLNAVFQQAGAPGVQKAWPLIAKNLGFSDEETSLFGEQLAADPEGTLTALDEGLNGASGSQPKEITIYKMLLRQDPTGAKAKEYMDRVIAGNNGEITPYQQAQLDLRREMYEGQRGERDRNYRLRVRGQNFRERTAADKAAGKGGKDAAVSEGAANNFRTVTGELRQSYENLRKGGALVDPGNDMVSNVTARARASGLGQLVEGFVGTQAQTERDKITSMRPALMQAIVKATGMSAKQIDSNAEMKLMLQQATDPTMSYQANMAAIKRLESMVANLSKKPATPARRTTLKPRATPGRSAKPSVSNW